MNSADVFAPDPGLQPQRTALSWTRTASAVLVNSLICLRSGVVQESRTLAVMAAVLLLVAVVGFWFGGLRTRQLMRATKSEVLVRHWPVLAVTWASCFAAATGMLAIVLNHV